MSVIPVRFGVPTSIDLKIWQQLDPQNNRLTKLRVEKARKKYRREIKAETRQIYFDNRGNANSMAIPYALSRMQLKKADEFTEQQYSIFRDVWLRLGGVESAAFIRTIYWMVIQRLFDARGRGVAVEEKRRLRRSGGLGPRVSPETIRKGFDELRTEWWDKLETKAMEWEADAQGKAVMPPQAPARPTQIKAGVGTRRVSADSPAAEFEKMAGALFIKELENSPTHQVSTAGLLSIADKLDASAFTPPLKYLESRAREKIAAYNQKFSSKALTTWRKLASRPAYQGAMRRRLAHAAQKVRQRLSAK